MTKKPTIINGKRYNSRAEALRQLQVTELQLTQAIENGGRLDPDLIGHTERRRRKTIVDKAAKAAKNNKSKLNKHQSVDFDKKPIKLAPIPEWLTKPI